jgi:signal transduction histidine kinase
MQVWTNLVDNALRAMGHEGTLVIETEDLGERVRVTVADTGCGVPAELAERAFDLDTTTRGPGAGLGLGLPVCRRIIERNHGGSISFRSRAGDTRFSVFLPKRFAGSVEV